MEEPPKPRRRRKVRTRDAELPLDLPATVTKPERARIERRTIPADPVADAPDLFDLATPAVVQESAPQATGIAAPEPTPTHLTPDDALLQAVDPRSFRPNERSDAWLYWLTDRDSADIALREGLPIDPSDPVLLSDRPAVLPRLASLAEDAEFSPQAIAVLRLRRIAAAPFLEPDREAACYRLSGGRNVSA